VARPVVRQAAGALALAAAVGLYALLNPGAARIWALRSLFLREVPWPRMTQLVVQLPRASEGMVIVPEGRGARIRLAQGNDLGFTVTAVGRVPDEVRLYYEYEGQGAEEGYRILQKSGDRTFQGGFDRLGASLAFHVEGGDDDDRDPLYHVEVLPAPAVERITASCRFPAYLRKADAELTSGDFEVPEGTEVKLSVTASLPLAQALLAPEKDAPREMQAVSDRVFETAFRAQASFSYSFRLVGRNGLTNVGPSRYTIGLLSDRPPRVTIVTPPEHEIEVTQNALIPILVVAEDDHGATGMKLRWRAARVPGEKDRELALEDRVAAAEEPPLDPAAPPRRLALLPAVELTSLEVPEREGTGVRKPGEGESLLLKLEAADNHAGPDGQPAPNVGSSGELRITVLRRTDLERRLGERQLRIKDHVRRLLISQEEQIRQGREVLTALLGEGGAQEVRGARLFGLEGAQNRIGGELERVELEIGTLFEAFLYNRLEASGTSERVLAFILRERRSGVDVAAAHRSTAQEFRSGRLGGSDALAKSLAMVELAGGAAAELSPAAARRLTEARAALAAPAAADALRASITTQEELTRTLRALLEKMEEWEDFQTVLQLVQDLIETQQGLRTRTIRELNTSEKK
jgi:hypothetical protein